MTTLGRVKQTTTDTRFNPTKSKAIRPRGHKTFFVLNSAVHEICPATINLKLLTVANSFLLNIAEHGNFSANKYENASYCWHFHIY